MNPTLKSLLALLAVLLSLGGCDLLTSDDVDTTGVITGRVVLEATGDPISGLGVALGQAGNGPGLFPIAAVRTDTDGAFRIDYDTEGDRSGLSLTINDEPYDDRYTVARRRLRPGEDLALGTVVLRLREGE